jgi:trimeric autotransporter adhesin
MKKTTLLLTVLALCLTAWASGTDAVAPQTAASHKPQATSYETEAVSIPRMLSYQGKLTDTLGQPVPNGIYSVAFKLYTVPSGGSSFWNETQNVNTRDGLFAVLLGAVTPIGSVPDAGAAYLGMTVAGGSELTPRLRLVSAAYAYKADTANYALAAPGGGDNAWVRGTPDSVLYTVHRLGVARGEASNMLYGTFRQSHVNLGVSCTTGVSGQNYSNITVGGGLSNRARAGNTTVGGGIGNLAGGAASVVAGGAGNAASGDYSSALGGYGDTTLALCGGALSGYLNKAGDAATDTCAVVAGGYGNRATGRFATVGGGQNDTASGDWSTVGGGRGNAADTTYATVGGGHSNHATGYHATVGGGYDNYATDDYATVGGGSDNHVTGKHATVGGGEWNSATGDYATVGGGDVNVADTSYATVGGGYDNVATGYAATVGGGDFNYATGYRATVGGGDYNHALGIAATVSGGTGNEATGDRATVPGGYDCAARGYSSLAAGSYAYANSAGSFVWSDSASESDSVYTTGVNQWRVRARGGAWFYSNLAMTTGAYLAPGSNAWTSACDSATKEDFRTVDRKAVLDKVAALRVRNYKMKDQDDGTRHIGPVAQDFHAAFGVGETETGINMADADGVLLAAVQALYEQNQNQQAEIEALKAKLAGQ